mgnify:CR=1 FL=1
MEANIEIAQTLFKQKKYQDTIETCMKILTTDSNSIEAIKLIAKSCLATRKIQDARLYLNKALNINPDDYELFQLLMNSQFFQNRFIQRSSAHINNTFNPSRIENIVDSLSNLIEGEIPRHIDRWGDEDGIESINDWNDELNDIKQFSVIRGDEVFDQLIDELILSMNK